MGGSFMLIQTGIFDWFSQNLMLTVGLFFVILVLILAFYLKLFARMVYEGTVYRHYRKGRLLRESDRGGLVILIPFIDKLEIIPPTEPTTDSVDEFE